MRIQVIGHTSFLGKNGYNAHSQNFFTNLNNYIPVRIRNFSYVSNFSEFEKKHLHLLIEQDWQDAPHKIGYPFIRKENTTYVNLILNESHHYYFYDNYESPMISYNVWESTKQIPEYFNRILQYDQFWCPTQWQRQCTIDQGYPENRVKVVPEGVDGTIFKPPFNSYIQKEIKKELYNKYDIPENAFTFMIFGRWDYRKSITEIIQAFNDEFKKYKNVYLILSADNPFSVDGLKTTEERLEHYKLQNDRIKVLHFPERDEYVKWLQAGDVFLSCARSEGWNLPLMEAIACGTPSICSDWSGQLEFADGIAHKVKIEKFLPPKQVFMMKEGVDIGEWAEPDFNHLRHVMSDVLTNYDSYKVDAIKKSKYIIDKYTWDNAAKIADKYIKELVKIQTVVPEKLLTNPSGIKLNLGCGNDIKPGYVNIDKYNNTGNVDLQLDIGDLNIYEDETIEEIYASHIFEHISINDMYSVLSEWKRVLQIGGRLVLRLPDLETEVKAWLNTPDDQKWNSVHRIFGAQNHVGNSHFCGFNCGSLKSFLERFDFKVTSIGLGNRGYGDEIQCTAIKLKDPILTQPNYTCHFVDGPFVEIKGDHRDKSFYQVDFVDPDSNANVHQANLGINQWTRPYRKFHTNWDIKIRRNGKYVYEHKFNLTGKNVLVSFDSKSMGDTLAWFPQVEEFRKKYKCNVFVSTFWNQFFRNVEAYKNLMIVNPGEKLNNLYASYSIGCYDEDLNKNRFNWKTVPLQKVAADTLGVDYKEIVTDINFKPGDRPFEEKYITLSEHSTFQCKYWNYENGWQTVIDYLNSIGYKVMVISKEETKLENIIDMTNKPIDVSMNNIYHSEFIMTVSCGPAWLAWALKKPVLMVSGFSLPTAEFETNIERVINEDVCHGCFNDPYLKFDRGDWNWCPRQKGTERQFECTKKITPDMVIERVNKLLKD